METTKICSECYRRGLIVKAEDNNDIDKSISVNQNLICPINKTHKTFTDIQIFSKEMDVAADCTHLKSFGGKVFKIIVTDEGDLITEQVIM